MKEFVSVAKRTINDRDGFVYGFIRGAMGSALLISVLMVFTACFG